MNEGGSGESRSRKQKHPMLIVEKVHLHQALSYYYVY